MRRATNTGAWLKVQPSTVNGAELGAQECRYSLALRYGLEPPDLPIYCDGYNDKFSIFHALDHKRGKLVMARHNEFRDGIVDLAGKAFISCHVRDNPLIFAGCTVKNPKAMPDSTTGSTDRDNATTPDATE